MGACGRCTSFTIKPMPQDALLRSFPLQWTPCVGEHESLPKPHHFKLLAPAEVRPEAKAMQAQESRRSTQGSAVPSAPTAKTYEALKGKNAVQY